MSSAVIIAILVSVFVIIMVVKGFKIIPQAETMVIERLGKYNRTLDSGVNIIWPIIEKPRLITWRFTKIDLSGNNVVVNKSISRIDLREQVFDFPSQNVITGDNVNIQIDALLYFQITDPTKAVYEIANLPLAIEKLTQTTLRNVIGELDLDDSLTSRDQINTKLRGVLDVATDKWGVKVNRVELQDISPPQSIMDEMEKQMRAERDRRAAILTAEGVKSSKILEAEGFQQSEINRAEGLKQAAILNAQGDAKARVLRAEAEGNAIKTIKEAIGDASDPVNYMVALKYLDTLKEMTGGEGTKTVFMPFEATGVLSSLGGIKEILKDIK